MKAVVCKQFGPPGGLVIETVGEPRAQRGDVVVRVKASGVSFPDLLMIQGKYQFKPDLPFIPGREVAGVVTEVGPGVTRLKPGDRVAGFAGRGAFAEEMRVEADKVRPIPDGIGFAAAAAFPLNYATAYHALKDRGGLKPGETLLVLGAAGGVGLAGVELGKLSGAKVIACASSDDKLETCLGYGADLAINYERDDLREGN